MAAATLTSATITTMDDTQATVKLGQVVGFKCDIEQASDIRGIRRKADIFGRPGRGDKFELLLNVTAGEYGRGEQWFDAEDVWVD